MIISICQPFVCEVLLTTGVRTDFSRLTVTPNNRSLSSIFFAGCRVIHIRHHKIKKAMHVTPDCSGFLMHCFSPAGTGPYIVPEPAERRAEYTGKTLWPGNMAIKLRECAHDHGHGLSWQKSYALTPEIKSHLSSQLPGAPAKQHIPRCYRRVVSLWRVYIGRSHGCIRTAKTGN